MPEALRSTAQLARLNHYERLGVAANAPLNEITSAYRRLSRLYHPDRRPPEECNGGFQLINDAYEVLSDPAARRNYDLTLPTVRQHNARSANPMPSARGYDFAWVYERFASGGVDPAARARDAFLARMRAEREAAAEREATFARMRAETKAFLAKMRAKSAKSATGLFTDVTDLQHYLNHLRMLEQEIAAQAKNPRMSDALFKAKRVVDELHKLISTDGRGTYTIRYGKQDSGNALICMTEVCSRVTQALHFVALDGRPFSCELFEASGSGARLNKKTYDADFHKESMRQLERIAKQLPGQGFKGLRNALFVLAAALLVAAVVVATCSTGGIGLAVVLGSVSLLTAGGGFFAGRDTGLFKTVHDVNTSFKTSMPLSR